MICCACAGSCDHIGKHFVCLTHAALRWKAPIVLFLLLACHPALAPIAAPASQPASQPASVPVNPPSGIFTPLDPSQPNGDQRITRAGMEVLAAHLVHERSTAAKQIANANARTKSANDERDFANAAAAESAWKTTWVPILTAVGGAAFAALVETFVVWGLNEVKPKAARVLQPVTNF